MVFPISEIDLTFNNFHEEIPYDVVDIIKRIVNNSFGNFIIVKYIIINLIFLC